jgi:hypothetical protein
MRLARVREHKKTVELTWVFTTDEIEGLSHAISCREDDDSRCTYKDRFANGIKLLNQLYNDISSYW